jgi:DnaA family protein
MRQLVLDIRIEDEASFDNFVVGDNRELLARLHALAEPDACQSIYLWGSPGSGRSHLLRATAALAQAQGRVVYFLRGDALGDDIVLPGGGLMVIDDVENLRDDAQITLFRAFNNIHHTGLSLLISGNVPPTGLPLREDLRTRIGQTLIFQVRAMSDEDKAQTFLQHAHARGLKIERDIPDYLLRHSERDLPSLLRRLDELDQLSLARKRPITVKLVRELLNAQPELDVFD